MYHQIEATPTIVCLCGSTRFVDDFNRINLRETLKGKIVLSIGCNMKGDSELFAGMSEELRAETKAKLDILHMQKIDLAGEIIVINRDGYIGESTRREIHYAHLRHKKVEYEFTNVGTGRPVINTEAFMRP